MKDFKTALDWWEKKRLKYNLILISFTILMILLRSEVPNGIRSYQDYIIVFFWIFGANIFYTIGWALEVLLNYYFKFNFFKTNTRRAFFILGSIFSVAWVYVLLSEL